MDNKLNLIKILKDVPKGTKLYSPMTGELTFINIFQPSYNSCYIELLRSNGVNIFFDSYGRYFTDAPDGECMLFPSKDQRNWDNFIPDKALVWGWDGGQKTIRALCFYDAINNSIFDACGKRYNYDDDYNNGYDNYELYKGEEPSWATEARKKLED